LDFKKKKSFFNNKLEKISHNWSILLMRFAPLQLPQLSICPFFFNFFLCILCNRRYFIRTLKKADCTFSWLNFVTIERIKNKRSYLKIQSELLSRGWNLSICVSVITHLVSVYHSSLKNFAEHGQIKSHTPRTWAIILGAYTPWKHIGYHSHSINWRTH
jgi:hypothetical protein